MPEFRTKEEYEEWKAERKKELEENPEKITNRNSMSNHRVSNAAGLKKAVSKAKRVLYACLAAYEQQAAKKKLRQQAVLRNFKEGKRKICCPACHGNISINAEACPKCGQPIDDTVRLDEIGRIKRNQSIIVVVIIGVIIFLAIVRSLPTPPPKAETESERQQRIEKELKHERELDEEERKAIERKEIGRQLESRKPILEKGCAEGDDRACSELRKF